MPRSTLSEFFHGNKKYDPEDTAQAIRQYTEGLDPNNPPMLAGYSKMGAKIFELGKTDIPIFDELLKNAKYFKDWKGMTRKVKWMSPDQYLDEARPWEKGKPVDKDMFERFVNLDLVDKYLQDMLNILKGTNERKFPLPYIERGKAGDVLGQEGRHRAMAARKLNVDQIPVLDITNRRY